MPGRLGELLVRENLISLQQLQKAQDEQRKSGGRLGSVIKGAGPVVGVLLLFNALAPDVKSSGRNNTERVRPTGN